MVYNQNDGISVRRSARLLLKNDGRIQRVIVLKFEYEAVCVTIIDIMEHNHKVIDPCWYGINVLSNSKYLDPATLLFERRDDIIPETIIRP